MSWTITKIALKLKGHQLPTNSSVQHKAYSTKLHQFLTGSFPDFVRTNTQTHCCSPHIASGWWRWSPYCSRIFHSAGLWTLSKALRRSTKFSIIGRWPSILFLLSTSVRKSDPCMHDLPGLNPACCWRSSWSTASLMRFNKILVKPFPGTDNRVMTRPLPLLHSVRYPFLGNGTWVTLCCHIMLHILVRRGGLWNLLLGAPAECCLPRLPFRSSVA